MQQQIVETEANERVETYYINVYERFVTEDGYDRGEYRPAMSFFLPAEHYTVVTANKVGRCVGEGLNIKSLINGIPPLSSARYEGGRFIVQTDTKVGADWTAQPVI